MDAHKALIQDVFHIPFAWRGKYLQAAYYGHLDTV